MKNQLGKLRHLILGGLCLIAFSVCLFRSPSLIFARVLLGGTDRPGLDPGCLDADCAVPPGSGGGGGGVICGNGIKETGEECERPNQMDDNGYCSSEKNMWCDSGCKCQLMDEIVDKTLDPTPGYFNQIEQAVRAYLENPRHGWVAGSVVDHGTYMVVHYATPWCYNPNEPDPELGCDRQFSTDIIYKRTWGRSKLMKYLKRYAPVCGPDPYQTCMTPNVLLKVANANVPDDPELHNQWNMCRVGAPYAWDIAPGNQPVTVAHIDTGVNLTHEDLAGLVTSGRIAGGFSKLGPAALSPGQCSAGNDYCFLNNVYNSFHQHGTHTFGVMAAGWNNALGISGIVPNNVKFYIANISGRYDQSIPVSGAFPWTPEAEAQRAPLTKPAYIIDALERVTKPASEGGPEAKVVYLGYDVSGGNDAFFNILTSPTRLRNALLVLPAGNNGVRREKPSLFNHAQVVVIGGTDQTDERYQNSNYGTNWVHLGAPGTSVLTTKDLTYESAGPNYPVNAVEEGTSFAAAHAAGALGLMYSVNGSLTAPDAKTFLLNYADPFPANLQCPDDDPSGCMGVGRLDARCATLKAQNPAMTSCPPFQNANINFTADPTSGVAPHNVDFTCSVSDALPCATVKYTETFADESITGLSPATDRLNPGQTYVTDHDYCNPHGICGCAYTRVFTAMCHADNDELSNDVIWDQTQDITVDQVPGVLQVTPTTPVTVNIPACPADGLPEFTFDVNNSEAISKAVNFSAAKDQPWLDEPNPNHGEDMDNACEDEQAAPGHIDVIQVHVPVNNEARNLLPLDPDETYPAAITFTDTTDNVPPIVQAVSVDPAPKGLVAGTVVPPANWPLRNYRGCSNYVTLPIDVTNSVFQSKPITYSVSNDAGWLTAGAAPSGELIYNGCSGERSSDQITFTVNSDAYGLPPGTSEAHVTLTGPYNTVVVPIQIIDPPSGLLQVTATSPSTQGLALGNPPYPNFTFQTRNAINQGKEITFTISSDVNWLTLPNLMPPTSGGPLYTGALYNSCPTGTHDIENVTVTANDNVLNLPLGLHTANVTFTSENNSVTKQIQIQVHPGLSISQVSNNTSFRRKGVTITFTDATGAPINMGQPLNNDMCLMFRKKSKIHSGGVYEPVTCGEGGNYSTCEDMKMTGPIYMEPVNPIDPDYLNSHSYMASFYTQSQHTNPKWTGSSTVKAYVPDVKFNTSGFDADIVRYDFDVTTECGAFKAGPVTSMATYHVDRDPMQTSNPLANSIDVSKVYIGQDNLVGESYNPPYMTPAYQSFPNPDKHIMPVDHDNQPGGQPHFYPAPFVQTTPDLAALSDYAAYRRAWVNGPGAPVGYNATGRNLPPSGFNPVGEFPAVFEIFSGLVWSATHNLVPNQIDSTPDYNHACSVASCDPTWGGTSGGNMSCQYSGGIPFIRANCLINNNPYIGGNTAQITSLHPENPLTLPFCSASGQWTQCGDVNQGVSTAEVYVPVYILHDVLGYSGFTPRSENCTEYDQVRFKTSAAAWDSNQNVMCGP